MVSNAVSSALLSFVFQKYNISEGLHKKIDMTTIEKNWVLFQVHRDHYVITFLIIQ